MSEDVLERYFTEIATAEVQDLPEEMDDSTTVGEAKYMAIRDLAAEVRRLRENEVCADTECRDLHIRELQEEIAFEKTKRDRFVDEALEITVEQEAELKAALAENTALRLRVAELEEDARIDAFYLDGKGET